MKRNKWKEYLLLTLMLHYIIGEARDFFYVREFTGYDFAQFFLGPAIGLFLLLWLWTRD